MSYLQDVPSRTGPDLCAACRKPLARHDRLLEIKIVAGVGPHPSGAGRCLYVSEMEEYAHADCDNRLLDGPFIELSRYKLKMDSDLSLIHARVPDYMCAVCKKEFQRGDRIVPVLIVEGKGMDPDTNTSAVQCSPEYEMVHWDCRDRQMTGAS